MNIKANTSQGITPAEPFDDFSANPIQVVTHDLDNPKSVMTKRIDYSNRSDRKWLTRHLHYCLTHRKSITTFQV